MTKQLLCVTSASMLLFGVSSAYAQVTTSTINGTITDAKTKELLIGASVVARHLPTGTLYGVATNAKGNFLIQGLRPGGPYILEVSYIGYQTVKLDRITLALGETETFNLKLHYDTQLLQDVVVTGKKGNTLNATRTGAATNFSRSALERTPTVERNLFDVARLAPGVSIASNGAMSFAGSNNRYNSFQIDGAVSNDVFGLTSSGTNGGQTGSTPISLEAIDALQVVIAPYDVRQSGFTGGGINAITKSGTNDLKASAYSFYKNQNFFGRTAGKENTGKRKKLDTQYEYTVGATLGGAIVRNKLFYFINAEISDERYPSRYLPGDGSEISLENAERVANHLKKLTGGFDAGGYGRTNIPRRSYKALARIDWHINTAHRFSLRYSYLNADKYNFSNTTHTLRFLNNGYTFTSQTHSIVAELNSRLSNSLNNEFRFGYNRVRDERSVAGDPMPGIKIEDGINSIYIGPDTHSSANALDQDVFTLTNNLTWSKGDHTLTLGTHNEFFTLRNLYIPNANGYYSFSSVADFENNQAVEYQYGYSNVPGQRYWSPKFSAAQLGLYLQDEWKLSSLFRLTYGVRLDMPLFLDTPTANTRFNESEIAKRSGIRNEAMPKKSVLISPRLGFRYQLDESKKHLIRGGLGLFTGRIPFVWISNSFGNTGVEISQIRLSSEDIAKSEHFTFSINPNKQYPFNDEAIEAKVNPTLQKVNINALSRNFKFPQTFRANLAFETVLPGEIKMVLEGIYSKSFNNIYYVNLNRELSGKTFAEANAGATYLGGGRPLYKIADQTFGDVIYLRNTDKGHSYNFLAQLSKDFGFGLNASLSYTYGKSLGVIDGTSSVAYSNWQYAYTYKGQAEEEMALTTFDTRHRIVANLNYRIEYAKHFATTIGLIYTGQTGNRFSMVYSGDVNGDGARFNDLMYVPSKTEIASLRWGTYDRKTRTFTPDEKMGDDFYRFITENEQINQYRGTYIPRNALVAPFTHRLDLHCAQDFYVQVGKRRHTLQLVADVMNFTNMLNPNWGVVYSAGYSQSPLKPNPDGSLEFSRYKTGKIWTLQDIPSRWQAQVGLKYIF